MLSPKPSSYLHHKLPCVLLLAQTVGLCSGDPGSLNSRRVAAVGGGEPAETHYLELHASFRERAQQGPVGLLFLGDSITRGWLEHGKVLWDKYYAPHDAANFGIGGDRTMGLIWRIENGALDNMDPKVVVLLIGTNNTDLYSGEEITAGIARIVALIRERLPRTKVLLLGIFPRGPRVNKHGEVDDHVARTNTITEANRHLAALDDGAWVRFLNLGPAYLNTDGSIPNELMPDQLHLSEAGYQRWAEAMNPLLTEMLGGE